MGRKELNLNNKNMLIVDVELKLKNSSLITLVSFEDYDKILSVTTKWYLSKRGYVQGNGQHKTIMLHRLIMDADDRVVDHINNNKLDNRRSNLRLLSHGDNIARGSRRKSKSKYRNVYVHEYKGTKRYYARLKINGKMIEGGVYKTDDEAGEAALKLRNKYRGDIK